jgi:hypothetical protein
MPKLHTNVLLILYSSHPKLLECFYQNTKEFMRNFQNAQVGLDLDLDNVAHKMEMSITSI